MLNSATGQLGSIPPAIRQAIEDFDWNTRPEGAYAAFITGPVWETASALDRMANASEILKRLVSEYQSPGMLESRFQPTGEAPLVHHLLSLSANSTEVQQQCYWLILTALLFELEFGATEVMTEHSWTLERLIPECQAYNDAGRFELTIQRCESHLGISRSEYGLNLSGPLRDKFNALGVALAIDCIGFFQCFADAFRLQSSYEYAVAVADCGLRSDLASECPDDGEARHIIRSRLDELLALTYVDEEGSVDPEFTRRQIGMVLDLAECFDLSMSQIILRADFGAVGPWRRRRELIREAVLGIDPGFALRWSRIETLATWAPLPLISNLWLRWLRNIDDAQIDSELAGRFSVALKDWRSLFSNVDWWSLPHPAGRTLLMAELVRCLLFRLGHRRAVEVGQELLQGERKDYWELATCLKKAPNPRLVRLANHAMNCLTLALVNEDDRMAALDRLEGYLEIGSGEDQNAFSEGLTELIRRRCGLGGAPADWDHAAFDLHLRLGALLIQINHASEGIALLKSLLGVTETGSTLDLLAFDRIAQHESAAMGSFLAAVFQLAVVENDRASLQHFLSQLLAIEESDWWNPALLTSAIRRCIADRKLSDISAYQLVCSVTTCSKQISDDSLIAIEVIRRHLQLDKSVEGQRPVVLLTQEPQVWALSVIDLVDLLVGRGDHTEALNLIACLSDRPLSERLEISAISQIFGPRGLGNLFENVFVPSLLNSAIQSLNGVGRIDEAVVLAKAVSQEWLNSDSESISTAAKCALALTCIRTLVTNDLEAVHDLSWDVSWFLSSDHESYGLTSVDRARLISLTVECRHLLREVANTLLLSDEFGPRTLVSLFRNELFLSVQQIVERIRRGVPAPATADGSSLAAGWAMPIRSRRRVRRSRFKARGTTALSQVAMVAERIQTGSPPQPDPRKRHEWFSNVRWRSQIVEAIGPGRQVLKVGFTLEGQLVWALLETEEERVVVRASGCGFVNARDTMTAAVQQFERKLDAYWDARALIDAGTFTEAVDNLQWQLNLDQGELISPEVFHGDAANRQTSLKDCFARTHDQFLQRFGSPTTWGKGNIPLPSSTEWERWWSETLKLLQQCPVDNRDFCAILDQLTLELLDDIAAVWPLEELFASLRPDVELLIQPSDVLHSVPIPFLAVRDANGQRHFLFEHVDTVAVVVSPLIDWWQRETLDSAPPTVSNEPHRLACLSWFGDQELKSDAALYASYLLQASHARLAQRAGESYGWWSVGGSRKRPGSHGALAQGLREAREAGMVLLTICAHGATRQSGVVLQDGLWQGREFLAVPEVAGGPARRSGGVDLADVQFVILLSCSMGRLQQSRLRDIEGFCVDLIVNHARSVLAGRWTLHAVDSIQFAHRVSRRYLRHHRKAVDDGQPLWKSCARGKAVAAARCSWAQDFRSGRAKIGINTVAALELYGLR